MLISSLLSGIVGCLLTLGYQFYQSRRRNQEELQRLKRGLTVYSVHALTEIYNIVAIYDKIFQQNEYRVDVSMLLMAREKLLSRFEDDNLLARVFKAESNALALNRTLDLYRDECFRASEQCTIDNPPTYLVELQMVIKSSLRMIAKALSDIIECADPELYRKLDSKHLSRPLS